MRQRIQELRRKLERRKGERGNVVSSIKKQRDLLKTTEYELSLSEQAKEIIHAAAQMIQQNIEYRLSDLVSLSMAGIFTHRPYSLDVSFVSKRGRVEADLKFKRGDCKIDPLSSSGGGAVDVGALALRFSILSMARPKLRPCVVLDEPLKWLKGNELPYKGANMIKKISEQQKVQVIMNSHSEELIEMADKVYKVNIRNRVSSVTQKGE